MTVRVNSKDLLCTIQRSALTDIEPKNKEQPIEELFDNNKSICQNIAIKKLKSTEGKSNIVITYDDILEFNK